jgi:PAS domain S-box-containing protein
MMNPPDLPFQKNGGPPPADPAPGGPDLASDRDLLAALLDHVTDRIYFKDRESRFIKISRSLAQDFGIGNPAEAVGKTDFDFFGVEHARSAFDDEQSIIRTGLPLIGKMEAENWKGGQTTWGLTTKVPLRNRTGEIIGTCGITKDISQLRQTKDELAEARDAALESTRAKGEFLANMSHELRTPLNAILGLSESLLERIGGPLTPRQIRSVTTISTSGAHLLALINDILDLSKIEAGRLELQVGPVAIDEFCRSCLAFVTTQAAQKRIGVGYEREPGVGIVQADSRRLKQILVNLLSNAVKFTPEGGRIGLHVAAPVGGEVVRFAVWDTGIGISSHDATRLFTAFTQIDSGLARAQEGTGLGLALVAKLAELHGGGVALESEPGHGSRFVVTLPLVASSAHAVPVTPQADFPARACHRVLIIEDDPTAGEQLVQYLSELGLASVLHGRGDEAVAVALRERPDVILLDIVLPVESGWTVLTRLKEDRGTRDIPVVVVSIVDEPEKSRILGGALHQAGLPPAARGLFPALGIALRAALHGAGASVPGCRSAHPPRRRQRAERPNHRWLFGKQGLPP